MLSRLIFYVSLAWNDLIRFRSSAFLQSLIVAGICFPVLILLALKRGHVEELREELVKSPTGRLVKIYPAGGGRPFTLAELDDIASELGNVDIAIPYVRRIVDLSSTEKVGDERNQEVPLVKNVDLYATSPGDPMLIAQNADVIKKGEDAIVLYDSVSTSLNVNEGDKVRLSITRSKAEEAGFVDLVVKKIIPSSSEDKIGFIDTVLINRLTKYLRGGGVPEWNWKSSLIPPTERYPTLLLINDAGDPLKPDDFKSLELLQFTVERATDVDEITLGGAITESNRTKVVIYRLTRKNSANKISDRISEDLTLVSRSTLATDAVIPWCPPREETVNNKKIKLVGLTLPPRCRWLHHLLLSPTLGFEIDSDYQQCQFISLRPENDSKLNLEVSDKALISLLIKSETKTVSNLKTDDVNSLKLKSQANLKKSDTPKTPSKSDDKLSDPIPTIPKTIYVPAKLLAYLDEYREGNAIWDSESCQLSAVISEPTYEDALVFADTIDDVPEIVANAVRQNFPFNAENARIEEIQKQDGSLQRLVLIVGLLVFSFGVLTVFGVLWESTARKRNIIGIMRVMGVTSSGAFLIVIIRAIFLGLLAACLTVLAGYSCVLFLNWIPPQEGPLREWVPLKPIVSAVIIHRDLYLVLAGSIFCCMLGSFVPALSASRLDPFDALVEGRYR